MGACCDPRGAFQNRMVWVHKRLERGDSCIRKMLGYRELPCMCTSVLTWCTHAHACTCEHTAPARVHTSVCFTQWHIETYTHVRIYVCELVWSGIFSL